MGSLMSPGAAGAGPKGPNLARPSTFGGPAAAPADRRANRNFLSDMLGIQIRERSPSGATTAQTGELGRWSPSAQICCLCLMMHAFDARTHGLRPKTAAPAAPGRARMRGITPLPALLAERSRSCASAQQSPYACKPTSSCTEAMLLIRSRHRGSTAADQGGH